LSLHTHIADRFADTGHTPFESCACSLLRVTYAPIRAVPKALIASPCTSAAIGEPCGDLTRSAACATQAHSLDLLEPTSKFVARVPYTKSYGLGLTFGVGTRGTL
jgi:hypothetical protein